MRKIFILGSLLSCLVVIVIGSYVIVAQTAVTGDWKAETKSDKPGKRSIFPLNAVPTAAGATKTARHMSTAICRD